MLSEPEVYTSLSTSPHGLVQTDAEARLRQVGRNMLQEVKGKPLWVKLLANFTHLMAILLWVGGLIALIAQMPQLGIAIWLVNVINGAFSFWQEFKAERATAALRRLLTPNARVRRDGVEQLILAEELVPGDVMVLAEGDRIAADGRLVEEAELRIDQSTLTGESHPVRKSSEAVISQLHGPSSAGMPAMNGAVPILNGHGAAAMLQVEMPNLVFAGTTVAAGTGVAVVSATGMNTEFGKIAGFTQSLGEEASPLQLEMSRVTKSVTVIAVAVGLIFFVLAAALAHISLAESFIFALGMIVAFVPEGLLPTVTLALAMGVQRMARRHALIKRLSAVETLGCTTVICTDKTGTLTQNEMTVRALWTPARPFTVTGVGYQPEGHLLADEAIVSAVTDADLRYLLRAAALCNNARLLPPNAKTPHWTILGDPTEAALCVVARKADLDVDAEARRTPRLREIPFESRRKCMTTIHDLQPESAVAPASQQSSYGIRHSSHRVAYVKGAPKEILALCTHVWRDGQADLLTEDSRLRIVTANDDYARQGLRVLAVAQRLLGEDTTDYSAETVERHLTFLGLVAMMDPPRAEVATAVQKCHQAGIRIVMITGDYGLTAESIARRIGIIKGAHPRLVTGGELGSMDAAALQAALRDEVIFARVAPEHKLRVVAALQAMGHIVAVTGDGVNDAPALKKADIGVAMGIMGTDVAKEAADMILTDDNFASIVNAVEEGRTVYANIKKFTTYIFTSNAPEAVPFILFAFSGARIPLALNVMHILAIDLGTDMAPALALGAELPEPGIMTRPPRSLREHVITRGLLLRAYAWLGPLQSLAVMAAFYFHYWTHGYWGQWLDLPASGDLYRSATAMALAAVVMTQIGNLFAQRTERTSVLRLGWFSNRLIWVGIATELLFIALIVYVPVFQAVIGTAAFPASHWLFLVAWMPALLVADELRKAAVRWQARRQNQVARQ